MQVTLDAIKRVFLNLIEPKKYALKLADVWSIEYLWDILKEKLRGCEYSDIEQLKNDIKKEWNINISICQ
jgi:hypothetical protein